MAADDTGPQNTEHREQRREWLLFLFLVIVFFPILTVIAVGGYGMVVWLFHMIAGPPGA